MNYQRPPVAAPRVSGTPLKLFVSALENNLTSESVLTRLVKDSGIERFRDTPATGASPLQLPLPLDASAPAAAQPSIELANEAAALPEVALGLRFETVARFAEAY